MARKYYIVPLTALTLDHLAGAIVTSVDTLRISPDKSRCVVKCDEKSDTCAALERLGYPAHTAESARTIADTWDSPTEVRLSTEELSDVVKRSTLSVADCAVVKPRLISDFRKEELAKAEAVVGELEP